VGQGYVMVATPADRKHSRTADPVKQPNSLHETFTCAGYTAYEQPQQGNPLEANKGPWSSKHCTSHHSQHQKRQQARDKLIINLAIRATIVQRYADCSSARPSMSGQLLLLLSGGDAFVAVKKVDDLSQ